MTRSRRRTRLARLRIAGGIGVVALAGCLWTTEPDDRRVWVESLEAPSAITSGATLEVLVTFSTGMCDEVTRLRGRRDGRTITIEARARYVAPGYGATCGDALHLFDSLLTFPSLKDGEYAIRGLRPSEAPIETAVLVGLP